MDDLLSLASSERAEELILHVGKPPAIVTDGETHAVEGPVITEQNAEELLRSLADTRQMRMLRAQSTAEFVYTFHNSARYLVDVRLEGHQIKLDLKRLVV